MIQFCQLHDAPGRSRRGFTLVELMISITLVLLLVIGINAIFRTTADTVGGGQAALATAGELRNAYSTFSSDLAGFLSPDRQPVLMIYQQNALAFRDKNDEKSDPAFSANGQLADILKLYDASNPNGVMPPTQNNANGSPVSLVIDNRNHRVDIMSFFSQGNFRRQTGGRSTAGDAPVYQSEYASDTAYIWYGHVLQPATVNNPNNNAWGNPFTYLPPGTMVRPLANPVPTSADNPNNFYANQWVLGRMAVLFADPVNGQIETPNQNGKVFEELLKPPASLGDVKKLMPIGYSSSTNGNPSNFITTSFCDLAGISAANFRQNIVMQVAVNGTVVPPRTPRWWAPLLIGKYLGSSPQTGGAPPGAARPDDALRFPCKPWPTRNDPSSGATFTGKAVQHDLALSAPAFIHGCSQFIVEFAGDYFEQNAAGPSLNKNSDRVTAMRADGALDFDVVQDANLGWHRRIRWYGLERKYPDNGITQTNDRHYLDVKPVVSWARRELGAGQQPLPFEKINSNDTFPGQLTPNVNSYTCAWSPYDMTWIPGDPATGTYQVAYPNGFLPWMIRITIRVDDPTGRLPDGQTLQYIFNLPHPSSN